MKNVLHLVRKFLPFTATFIRNQIENHIEYTPQVIFKEYINSGNSRSNNDLYKTVNLDEKKTGWNRIHSKVAYNYFRKVSQKDINTIINYINSNNISICHFHYGTDAGMFWKILKKINIPSVVSFYGYDCSSFPQRLLGYGKYYLQKRVFRQVSKVLAMSPDMKKDLLAIGCPEGKIIVHYYGTDTQKFFDERSYLNKDCVDFLIISGLTPQKGHKFLINAFDQACNETKQKMRLHIVGDGPLKGQILDLLKMKNNEHIIYHGSVKYGSKRHKQFFSQSDVFIHPSITDPTGAKEGIPGAIIEAMSAGLPVISTYHAGIPYVLKHGETGLLVREWDVDGLTDCMITLAKDATLQKQLGKLGQDYAMDNLDLMVKEKELEDIYDSLLEI